MSHKELWQDKARIVVGDEMIEVVENLCVLNTRTTERLEEIEKRHKTIDEHIVRLHTAFPDNDVEGHRRYHEAINKKLASDEAFRRAIIEKSLTGLVWAALIFLATSAYHEAQNLLLRGR
jgi:hypothetical protein